MDIDNCPTCGKFHIPAGSECFKDTGILEMAKTLGEMGKKLSKCECKVVMDDYSPDHGFVWDIEYCPVHEAAPELWRLCREALSLLKTAQKIIDTPRKEC